MISKILVIKNGKEIITSLGDSLGLLLSSYSVQ